MATFWEIAANSIGHMFWLPLSICNSYLFPILVLRDLALDCYSSCSLLFYYFFRDRTKRRLCFDFVISAQPAPVLDNAGLRITVPGVD